MNCLSLVSGATRAPGKPLVVSIVGGGGKTSLLFALADDASAGGRSVLVTTTTRIFDPRDEGRRFDELLLEPGWGVGAPRPPAPPNGEAWRRNGRAGSRAAGPLIVAAAGVDGGRLLSVDPARVDEALGWDLVAVEADGARRLPLKAPADHEPVVPGSSGAVIAVIGLDCLGRRLDDTIAFRPELVAAAAGMAEGETIRPRHLAALAASPSGCFKSSPPGALRVVVLNKLDLVDGRAAAEASEAVIASGAADIVALARLADPDPSRRVASAAGAERIL